MYIHYHRGGTEAEGKFSDGDIVLAIDGELVATATDVEASVQVRRALRLSL